MKILAASDIHGAQFRLNQIIKNVEKHSPDLVVICGDITQFGPGELAKIFLDQIPCETLAVTGNIDTEDVKKGIDKSKAINIELKKYEKDNINFVGINGSNPRDYKVLKEKKLINENTVIISHVPPRGLQDKIFMGLHGGSKELREIIEDKKPRLVLCGHIHEDPGYINFKNTMVVNCSMGLRGEGAIVTLNQSISVNMIE